MSPESVQSPHSTWDAQKQSSEERPWERAFEAARPKRSRLTRGQLRTPSGRPKSRKSLLQVSLGSLKYRGSGPDYRQTHPCHAESGILGRQGHAQVYGKIEVLSRLGLLIMSEHTICIHCKKPETAAQFGLQRGRGEGTGKACSGKKKHSCCLHTHIPSIQGRQSPASGC